MVKPTLTEQDAALELVESVAAAYPEIIGQVLRAALAKRRSADVLEAAAWEALAQGAYQIVTGHPATSDPRGFSKWLETHVCYEDPDDPYQVVYPDDTWLGKAIAVR